MHLNKTKTHKKLESLVSQPVDLTQKSIFNSQRIQQYQYKYDGITLSYASQRVTDEVISTFQELSKEQKLIEQFKSMLSGEIVNKVDGFESENRCVQHHNSRNFFADLATPFTINNPNYQESLLDLKTEYTKLQSFCKKVESGEISNEKGEKFNTVVSIGIGGSHLGPQAIYTALQAYKKDSFNTHFISNVDPDDTANILQKITPETTLVCIISKSGSTLETLTNETFIKNKFTELGLNPQRHFLCITGKGSPMDDKTKYLESFYIFDYIGGRYSVCSMVGAVTLALSIGFDQYNEILRGARSMDINSLESDITKNLALMAALLGVWNRNYLAYETHAILAYSQAMSYFTQHLQQCDMESNGKTLSKSGEIIDYTTGPIIWGEPGTNGQHAFYQLIHQSKTVVPCDFILFKNNQYGQDIDIQGTNSQEKLIANCIAQVIALATGKSDTNPNKHFTGNRPNSLIISDRLVPYSIGQLLAFYENKIAFQGFIWDVNSFDQEGVQLGKILANKVINKIKDSSNNNPVISSYLNLL